MLDAISVKNYPLERKVLPSCHYSNYLDGVSARTASLSNLQNNLRHQFEAGRQFSGFMRFSEGLYSFSVQCWIVRQCRRLNLFRATFMLLAALECRQNISLTCLLVSIPLGGSPCAWSQDSTADNQRLSAMEQKGTQRMSWFQEPEDWHVRWSRPVQAECSCTPVVAAGLTAWLSDGKIHGVQSRDGRPAWRHVPSNDTLIFPRSMLPPVHIGVPNYNRPHSVFTVGHLLYANIYAGGLGPYLVCLDCSDTAEGRLMWSIQPPEQIYDFDGPPIADHELCVVIGRGKRDRSVLEIVTCDAKDGTVLWRRRLGTGVARDGVNYARGQRQASLIDNLIVVADHAGSVWAFYRDGRLNWRYEYGKAPQSHRSSHRENVDTHANPIVGTSTGLLITAQDKGGLIKLSTEPEGVKAIWEVADQEQLRLVGCNEQTVVVQQYKMHSWADVATYSIDDGSLCATRKSMNSKGPAVMREGLLLHPSVTPSEAVPRIVIDLIDPVSLKPMKKPFQVPTDTISLIQHSKQSGCLIFISVKPDAMFVASPSRLFSIGPLP